MKSRESIIALWTFRMALEFLYFLYILLQELIYIFWNQYDGKGGHKDTTLMQKTLLLKRKYTENVDQEKTVFVF